MDATTAVALAGIGATLLAGIAGPLLVERVRREGDRRASLLDRRLDVYADLLRVTGRVADNASTWSAIPLAELEENDEDELNHLVARARVVASRTVYEQLNHLTRRALDFYRLLHDAKAYHHRVQESGHVDDGHAIQQRFALGGIADDIVATHKKLEATVRDEVKV